jgi:hypothetical protein
MVLESYNFQPRLVADFKFVILLRNILLSTPAFIYSVSKFISQSDRERVRQQKLESCSKPVMVITVIKYILQFACSVTLHLGFCIVLYTSNYFFNFIRGVGDWNHDM